MGIAIWGGEPTLPITPHNCHVVPFFIDGGGCRPCGKSQFELRAISKRYGGFEAVKSVSFSLMEGELCALIGENGAGKSTLIRLITGLSEPSSGTISMFGQTGRREIRSCRERLGYMPDLNASYPNLTARDNLVVRCIEWGLPTDRSIDGVLSTVGLGEAGGKKVKNFSMGMRSVSIWP